MNSFKSNQIKSLMFVVAISLLALSDAKVVANEVPTIDQEKSTVLITGSNRGIGLSLAQNYAEQGWNVIATCRKPNKAIELISLKREYNNVNIEELDVTSQDQIIALARKYDGIPIDVLLNNAGILGEVQDQVFGALNDQTFNQVFYRMSKAALNMGVVAMNASLRKQGVISALIAPGQVDTKLLAESGYRGPNKISPDESAKSLIKIIDALSQETLKENGNKAINVDERVIPW